jgi:segregation and condensation protein B
MTNDALIEAILFEAGEPLARHELCLRLTLSNDELTSAIAILREKLTGRGIILIETADSLALATAPEATHLFSKESDTRALSKGALEVLALIAYQGAATQTEIDTTRGVHSQSALRQLLVRGLISRTRSHDAAAYEYKITPELLAHLGLAQIENLPDYEEIRAALHAKAAETV